MPPTTGYRVYVFYRALPSDPWGVYGFSSGSFAVSGLDDHRDRSLGRRQLRHRQTASR